MTSTEFTEFLAELSRQGVELWADGGRLRYRAPTGALTPALRTELAERKEDILPLLRARDDDKAIPTFATLPAIVSDDEHRYEPFPLTDLQQAYWIGRSETLELGNVAAHSYMEFECPDLDLERLTRAWRHLIARHDMLRAVVRPDGQQQILCAVPPYQVAVTDLRAANPESAAAQVAATRQRLAHQVLPADRWPLFELHATRLDERRTLLHLSFDLLTGDAWSFLILARELEQLYENPATQLAPLTLSFRDYVLAQRAFQDSARYRQAQAYWRRRLPELPPAPALPLAREPRSLTHPHFVRRQARLEPAEWARLKQRAARAGLTPSAALAAAFAEVLTAWSTSPRFTLNLTFFNRRPMHPQVYDVMGDFSTTLLLAVDGSQATQATFEARAQRLQKQLWEDLEYSDVGGVQVLRELAQQSQGNGQDNGRGHGHGHGPGGGRAVLPVVFTSLLALDAPTAPLAPLGTLTYALSQTPQVWLDHQVSEQAGALILCWDAVAALFPPGLLDDMFAAYTALLQRLATSTDLEGTEDAWTWTMPTCAAIPTDIATAMLPATPTTTATATTTAMAPYSLVPPAQLAQRAALNATAAPLSDELLHTLFAVQVPQRPDQPAVLSPTHTLTYAQLARQASRLAHQLRARGARPNTLVGVVMDKGWEQVVAVLGILRAGAAYLPLDPALPAQRLAALLEQGAVAVAVTQPHLAATLAWPSTVTPLCITAAAIETTTETASEAAEAAVASEAVAAETAAAITAAAASAPRAASPLPTESAAVAASAAVVDSGAVDTTAWAESAGDLAAWAASAAVQQPHDLAYVIYTSGSTGQPKGVMIDHRGAVNTIRDINARFGVGPADRVLALSALGFDLSVYDIFGPLAAGGTIVLPDPAAQRDPAHWLELLERQRVSVWNSVPALLQMLVLTAQSQRQRQQQQQQQGATPNAAQAQAQDSNPNSNPDQDSAQDPVSLEPRLPASLRLALLSGDWIPLALPDQLRALAPTVQVVSLGGATEASIWSVLYPLPNPIDVPASASVSTSAPVSVSTSAPTSVPALAWASIPYGYPMTNQQLHVLDAALAPCPVWVPGDLYIGGVGLARGYWGDPERTQASFVRHPCSGERLYRTGDRARYRPEGVLEFLGRADLQVKVQGYRIEIGEIEAALGQHAGVGAAVVTVVGAAQEAKRLVAYVVPRPPGRPHSHTHPCPQPQLGLGREPRLEQESGREGAQGHEEGAGEEQVLTVEAVRAHLAERLPAYMVPRTIVLLDALPLTANGKLDRAALPDPALYEAEGSAMEGFVAPRTPTEEQAAAVWARVLKVEHVSVHDDFFELGGDSLLATQLMSGLRDAFEVDLPLRRCFETPTIAGLAEAIDQIRRNGSAAPPAAPARLDLDAEAVLDPAIRPGSAPIEFTSDPAAIFLTGASGFLGAFLLHELLQQTKADVYCLVRAGDGDEGMKRLQSNLRRYALWREELSARIIPVAGDLAQPRLGLSDEQFEMMARRIDVIYHNGAVVNFTYPYAALKKANVLGTQEVLRLASHVKVKPVHFTSTVAVFDTTGAAGAAEERVIREQDGLDHDHGDRLYFGYAQSKWVAERLLMAARSRGLPVCIYRPGRITGHSRTGACHTDDLLCQMIKGFISLGREPDLDMMVDMTPVDYVSRAIVALSRRKDSLGQAFHLINPQPVHWSRLATWIRAYGYPLRQMPYDAWRAELARVAAQSGDAAVQAFAPLVMERAAEGPSSLLEMYMREKRPRLDDQNTRDGLKGMGIACPPIDNALLDVYFSYFVRSGFLNAPPRDGHGVGAVEETREESVAGFQFRGAIVQGEDTAETRHVDHAREHEARRTAMSEISELSEMSELECPVLDAERRSA